ncbi:MAG: hypothetical protein Q9162_003709 [Coniocarpon cinnabarinum]
MAITTTTTTGADSSLPTRSGPASGPKPAQPETVHTTSQSKGNLPSNHSTTTASVGSSKWTGFGITTFAIIGWLHLVIGWIWNGFQELCSFTKWRSQDNQQTDTEKPGAFPGPGIENTTYDRLVQNLASLEVEVRRMADQLHRTDLTVQKIDRILSSQPTPQHTAELLVKEVFKTLNLTQQSYAASTTAPSGFASTRNIAETGIRGRGNRKDTNSSTTTSAGFNFASNADYSGSSTSEAIRPRAGATVSATCPSEAFDDDPSDSSTHGPDSNREEVVHLRNAAVPDRTSKPRDAGSASNQLDLARRRDSDIEPDQQDARCRRQNNPVWSSRTPTPEDDQLQEHRPAPAQLSVRAQQVFEIQARTGNGQSQSVAVASEWRRVNLSNLLPTERPDRRSREDSPALIVGSPFREERYPRRAQQPGLDAADDEEENGSSSEAAFGTSPIVTEHLEDAATPHAQLAKDCSSKHESVLNRSRSDSVPVPLIFHHQGQLGPPPRYPGNEDLVSAVGNETQDEVLTKGCSPSSESVLNRSRSDSIIDPLILHRPHHQGQLSLRSWEQEQEELGSAAGDDTQARDPRQEDTSDDTPLVQPKDKAREMSHEEQVWDVMESDRDHHEPQARSKLLPAHEGEVHEVSPLAEKSRHVKYSKKDGLPGIDINQEPNQGSLPPSELPTWPSSQTEGGRGLEQGAAPGQQNPTGPDKGPEKPASATSSVIIPATSSVSQSSPEAGPAVVPTATLTAVPAPMAGLLTGPVSTPIPPPVPITVPAIASVPAPIPAANFPFAPRPKRKRDDDYDEPYKVRRIKWHFNATVAEKHTPCRHTKASRKQIREHVRLRYPGRCKRPWQCSTVIPKDALGDALASEDVTMAESTVDVEEGSGDGMELETERLERYEHGVTLHFFDKALEQVVEAPATHFFDKALEQVVQTPATTSLVVPASSILGTVPIQGVFSSPCCKDERLDLDFKIHQEAIVQETGRFEELNLEQEQPQRTKRTSDDDHGTPCKFQKVEDTPSDALARTANLDGMIGDHPATGSATRTRSTAIMATSD